MMLGPSTYPRIFPLGDPPDYEPSRDESIAAIAAREGRSADEVLYDRMLDDDARALLLFPLLNYSQLDGEPIREMLLHPGPFSASATEARTAASYATPA